MLFVLLVFSITIIVAGFYLYNKRGGAGTVVGAIGFIIGIIVICGFAAAGGGYISTQTLDEKIAMYETENVAIERSVAQTVSAYIDYEKGTFSSLSLKDMDTKDITTLVSLFPTLKSDTLVKSQIDNMVSNNTKIKTLKEQKITSKVYSWWLFFTPIR